MESNRRDEYNREHFIYSCQRYHFAIWFIDPIEHPFMHIWGPSINVNVPIGDWPDIDRYYIKPNPNRYSENKLYIIHAAEMYWGAHS